ncbi:hypothetical protein PALB_24860 [Pseudoalteromonas luteoviolacea B = ATCC 29581]|nr:hypothetical protein PALB_24860 [Pseudoalteromonas luteoviolacea B = ATCC 29581]
MSLSPVLYASTVDALPNLVEKWISLSKQKGALEVEWQNEKQILEQQKRLLEAELLALTELLEKQKGSTSDVDEKREVLIAQQQSMEAAQQQLAFFIDKQFKVLRDFSSQLPPPLQLNYQQLFTALKESKNGETTNTSKLNQLVEFYQQWTEFDRRVVVQETVMAFDGETVLVEQLYLGSHLGWYVAKQSNHIGYGYVKEGQWIWLPANDIPREQLLDAIAMYRKQKTAEMVTLPLPPFGIREGS